MAERNGEPTMIVLLSPYRYRRLALLAFALAAVLPGSAVARPVDLSTDLVAYVPGGTNPSLSATTPFMAFVDSSNKARIWNIQFDTERSFNPTPPAPWSSFGATYALNSCVIGETTVFCEGVLEPFGLNVLVAHSLSLPGATDHLVMNTADFKLRSAFKNFGLYTIGDEVHVAQFSSSGSLSSVTAVTGSGGPHSPVIGHFGNPSLGPYVVYVTEDPVQGLMVEALDLLYGMVVSRQSPFQSLGITQPTKPQLSSWHGSERVYFNGNSAIASNSLVAWNPAVRFNPYPEPPSPPYLVESTPMVPSMHGCTKLDNVAFGPEFAAVGGSGCGDQQNMAQLSVVATRNDHFLTRDNGAYQVFMVHDWQAGSKFEVRGNLLVYESSNGGIKVVQVDAQKIGSIPTLDEPDDNDTVWRTYVYPWNVGSQVSGHVDYASGGLFDRWTARLLLGHSYRVLAVGHFEGVDVACSSLLTDTYINVFLDGLLVESADVNLSGIWSELSDCAGLIINTPNEDFNDEGWLDYDIEVSRYWPGGLGSPGLDYDLYIEPF